MAINDVYRVLVQWTDGNTLETNTINICGRQPGALAPSITNVGDAVKDWWNAAAAGGVAMKSWYTSSLSLSAVKLRRLKPIEPVELIYTTGLPIAGTNTSDAGRSVDAIVVSLRTAKIGRSYRGRVFLPSPAEDKTISSGILSTTDAGLCKVQFQDLLTDLAGFLAVPCVFSRVLDTSDDITSIFVDRKIRAQRRRQSRLPVYV